MRLCKLKLKNLNSFREPLEIDFENSPLGDASLVAITGPTGAGKTTLLDAICVALYDKTPRLSGTGSQNRSHLISHGEKEGFAEVHFIANNTRYIATWTATQKGAPKGELRYADGDKLITDKLAKRGKSLGSSQRTVSEEVASILGLDFDAFKRSVMLAQGEFAAFLKASREDRRTILEATAGIHIYDLLRQTLNEKVSAVEAANAAVVDALNKIPEASREQLSEAETVFDRLQVEAEALGTQSQQIENKKQREEERKKDFEKLQSSEERQDALTNEQQEIDGLQETLENANRAQRLLPEKQAYDTAESELENATEALRIAMMAKTAAEARVKTEQTVYDEKETAYQTAANQRDQKMPIYADARLDIGQAKSRFAEAEKREPNLAAVTNQIDALEAQLSTKQTKQTELQEQIDDAQRFLDDNPLPADRQHRLTRTTRLLEQLKSQEKQLQTELTNKANAEKNLSSLKQEIEKLSNVQQKHLSEKAEAETALADATTQLNKLLATGTHEEWTARKQQAARAYPIVHGYEEMTKEAEDFLEQVTELKDTVSTLNAELVQIEAKLQEQTAVCQHAAKAVERCEETLRSEMLTNPINQLRQHLHIGEPCLVCGATEHPYAGVVEPENEERLQDAKNALENAKAEAQGAQDQMQVLKTKRTQTEYDRRNAINQSEDLSIEAGLLENKKESLDTQWKEISPALNTSFASILEGDINISSEWIVEQMSAADIAIAALGEAQRARTEALHAYEMLSQQLETSENDIKRETKDLNEVETQLEDLNNTIADLQADIDATETRFWESMPDTFHGISAAVAVEQFDDKIEEVGKHEAARDSAKTQLQLLNVNIEADQANLKGLKELRETLNAEIDGYRREGETYLSAVRDKTGGLEMEDAINAAIDELEAGLQLKKTARDEATQQLQESQTLLTQKQTTHRHCEEQYEESSEKRETARDTYFKKLRDAGFDSPEAHNNAFRDEAQMQELTEQIDAHEDEKQHLEVEIIRLRTRFEETPFDPQALGRIEAELEKSGEKLQAAQQEVGAQQQKIGDLKDALEKREALGAEIREAEQELKRWKRLQDTIPRNDLRDFALEIMFKQMGSIANVQLRYLTSERYQLKVEGIGDLTVVDRWNANEERPVETLSGGESFLTSLALALALADLSRGRAQLNSLFLDEGFGTLDTETLDIAIAALEGLRMQGRSIFLISHIQELTRRLPVKINVRKRGNGSSSVNIRD